MPKAIEEIRQAFHKIHDVATGKSDRAYMSIPADRDRDADLILSDAICELEAARLRISELEAVTGKALAIFKEADEERLRETDEAHDEAAKWKAEGDMYGWNFHEGRAGGTTAASIIFHRVRRVLEAHN